MLFTGRGSRGSAGTGTQSRPCQGCTPQAHCGAATSEAGGASGERTAYACQAVLLLCYQQLPDNLPDVLAITSSLPVHAGSVQSVATCLALHSAVVRTALPFVIGPRGSTCLGDM